MDSKASSRAQTPILLAVPMEREVCTWEVRERQGTDESRSVMPGSPHSSSEPLTNIDTAPTSASYAFDLWDSLISQSELESLRWRRHETMLRLDLEGAGSWADEGQRSEDGTTYSSDSDLLSSTKPEQQHSQSSFGYTHGSLPDVSVVVDLLLRQTESGEWYLFFGEVDLGKPWIYDPLMLNKVPERRAILTLDDDHRAKLVEHFDEAAVSEMTTGKRRVRVCRELWSPGIDSKDAPTFGGAPGMPVKSIQWLDTLAHDRVLTGAWMSNAMLCQDDLI